MTKFTVMKHFEGQIAKRTAFNIACGKIKGKNAIWVAERLFEYVMQNTCCQNDGYFWTGKIWN